MLSFQKPIQPNYEDRLTDSAHLDRIAQIARKQTRGSKIDRRYPDRSYYQLWLGKVNQQKQAKIAQQLGLTQSTISKRWQELLLRLTIELDLTPAPSVDRTRSDRQW